MQDQLNTSSQEQKEQELKEQKEQELKEQKQLIQLNYHPNSARPVQ